MICSLNFWKRFLKEKNPLFGCFLENDLLIFERFIKLLPCLHYYTYCRFLHGLLILDDNIVSMDMSEMNHISRHEPCF